MPAAALLFMDVVGYSAESTDVQFDTIMDLNREVLYVLYHDFDPKEPKVIALPTGDGMLLVLLDDDSPRPDLAQKCFELLEILQTWTNKSQKATLRYGLHYGPVSFVRDINDQRNICGDAVNVTARLMSLGQANHVIASYDFINRFVPGCGNNFGEWTEAYGFRLKVVDEVDLRVKHGRRILGYNLLLEGREMEVGNPEDLDIKYHADVRFPAVSKEESRRSTLGRILPEAEEITIIGLSYRNLPSLLEMLGGECRKVIVCIPSDKAAEDAEQFFEGTVKAPASEDLLGFISDWRSSHKSTDVSVFQYPELPPFGALLVERSQGLRGFLHLSMYLRGVAPEETPFMELIWSNTAKPPELYRFYADYLKRMTKDWNEVPLDG